MKKRERGFYKVKRVGFPEWEVALWTGKFWLECGYELMVRDSCYSHIDEIRIELPVKQEFLKS
jgi:hypothetical protein